MDFSTQVEYIVKRTGELGLQIKGGSRLCIMISAVRLFEAETQVSAELLRTRANDFVEAQRDVQQIYFILKSLQVNTSDFADNVKTMLRDSVAPHVDLNNSPGRDMQHELHMVAICQNAGLCPRRGLEPDVRCSYANQEFALEAKRLKNLDGLEEHVKKGANQIFKSKCEGAIAIDMSLAFHRGRQWSDQPVKQSDWSVATQRTSDKFVRDFGEKLRRWTARKWVSGVIITTHYPRLDPLMGWGLEGHTFSIETSDNEARRRHFTRFFEQFAKGLHTDETAPNRPLQVEYHSIP